MQHIGRRRVVAAIAVLLALAPLSLAVAEGTRPSSAAEQLPVEGQRPFSALVDAPVLAAE